jgi:hypothetical protein
VIALADRRLDADPVGLALLGRHGKRCVHAGPDSDWKPILPPLPLPTNRLATSGRCA